MKLNHTLKGLLILEGIALISAGIWRMEVYPSQHQAVVQEYWRHNFAHQWRPATGWERKTATAAIESQLKAFKKNDYQHAAAYQSANMRLIFARPTEFRMMIQRTYPQFARYKTVKFGAARSSPEGHRVIVPVTLTGEDGVIVHALYRMVLEGKAFRVDGVEGGIPPHPAPPEETHPQTGFSA